MCKLTVVHSNHACLINLSELTCLDYIIVYMIIDIRNVSVMQWNWPNSNWSTYQTNCFNQGKAVSSSSHIEHSDQFNVSLWKIIQLRIFNCLSPKFLFMILTTLWCERCTTFSLQYTLEPRFDLMLLIFLSRFKLFTINRLTKLLAGPGINPMLGSMAMIPFPLGIGTLLSGHSVLSCMWGGNSRDKSSLCFSHKLMEDTTTSMWIDIAPL